MARVYNFSAGPAVLPEAVLKKAAEQMLDYEGSGMSVMEMSHRSSTYQKIIDDAEAGIRKLMEIPSNYKVLFLQGGANLQFLMIPMNLAVTKKADYVDSGEWSSKAIKEAKKYGVDEYAIKYIVGHKISDITEKVYTQREIQWLKDEIEKIK